YDEDSVSLIDLRTVGGTPEEQEAEFENIFKVQNSLPLITSKAFCGELRTSHIRSVYWKVFFGLCSSADWSSIQSSRSRYDVLIEKHTIDPHKLEAQDVNVFNPLSQNTSNPWTQFFQNTELNKLITQDLERLYPEHAFFRKDDVQAYMQRILFVWARENEETSYRQGMHELLAPIVLVLYRDARDASLNATNDVQKTLSLLFDKKYLEHDAFMLFERLMKKMKEFFLIVNTPKKAKNDPEEDPTVKTPIHQICHRIQSLLLNYQDPELCKHLKELNIEPQIYGLRWIRLLFGREFHIEDAMVIWDGIFADSGAYDDETFNLDLVEHIAINMLIYIRQQLLVDDYSHVLRRLMKYPPVEDPHVFVERALESRKNPYKKSNSTPEHTTTNSTLEKKLVVSEKKTTPSVFPLSKASSSTLHNHHSGSASALFSSFKDNIKDGLNNIGNHTPSVKKISKPKKTVNHTQLVQEADNNYIAKELKMAKALNSIISELTPMGYETEKFNPDTLLMSIARLKLVRDALEFQFVFEDVLGTHSVPPTKEEEAQQPTAQTVTITNSDG
ncbi:hypothetical protein AKO1_008951, partial [Acrasis kona]